MEVKPGYKQTDFGVLPDDWNVELLGRCVRTDAPICYGILMPGTFHAQGVPVIKVKDITGGRIEETNLLLTHPAIDFAYRRSRLQAGDVLVTIRGTTGRVAIVPPSLAGANITQDTARARINSKSSGQFIYLSLQSEVVQNQVQFHTIGQAVKGINIRDVKNLAIPLPPTKAEQEAIAEALSDADGLKQLPRRSGECLLEIIMRRHENRSTMMTSNRPLEDWAKLIGDAPAATAILDRFLQHATIINITGKSYRLRHPAMNPGGKTETDTPPVAATDSDTTKQTRGRRSTGDGEGLSPPEDTADRKPISSGSGAASG